MKKWRATFLSALVFPGLGQILMSREVKVRLLGCLMAGFVLVATGFYLLELGSKVVREARDIDLSSGGPENLLMLSIQIQKKIEPEIRPATLQFFAIVIPVWAVSVLHAWAIDRRRQ